MYIDVCFPDRNEQKFIETAKKLLTRAVAFVYKNQTAAFESNEIKVYRILYSSGGGHLPKGYSFFLRDATAGNIKKGSIYLIPRQMKNNIVQTVIRDIAESDSLVGIPLIELVKNPLLAARLSFILKLCAKHKARVCAASFAASPYEMKAEKEARSLITVISGSRGLGKSSVNGLWEYLEYSARFL